MQLQNQMSTAEIKKQEVKEAKEIRLKVPWGHIASKTWGSPNDFPILLVHGKLDNAGSFDRLIAQLPNNYFYVCIDLPGHGFSSHFSQGVPLNFFNYVLTLRYILEELKWECFHYIGHSFGAQLGTFFSILYPGKIRKLILIEGMIPPVNFDKDIITNLRKMHNETIERQNNAIDKLYTRSDIIYALKYRRGFCLRNDAAESIFKRSVSKVGELFRYNRDSRLKITVAPLLNLDQILAIINNMNVDILLFLTTGTLDHMQCLDLEETVIGPIKKINKINLIYVKGNHDIQINYPERISFTISEFLNKNQNYLSKL